MKHLKHVFTALLLLCATAVAAHDFEVGGIYYNILSEEDKTVAVTFNGTSYLYNDYTGGVVIPQSVTYNGSTYSVTSIGDSAFRGCINLTSITIPNSVTSIGEWVFYNCSGLTSIVIGNGVTSIGENAFYNCTGLTSIEIPNSVTSIGDYAFYECSGLTSIEIPNSVTSIGERAFYNCTGLTGVEFNAENCTTMGSSFRPVFSNCTSLSTVTIGENVKNIPAYAFYRCDGLTSIVIPNSVTSIGAEAFCGCSGLTGVEFNAENCTTMSSSYGPVFSNCTSLSTVTIGENVKNIPAYAFYRCDGLTSIEIPNSVTSIGEYAFYNCSGLANIVIGVSVTSIGDFSFYGCENLKTIVNFSELTLTAGAYINGYVAYYASKVVNAPNASFFNGDFLFVADGEKTLVGYLGNATDLTLPTDYNGENYVIGNKAFYGCSGLSSVVIPNSVIGIGGYAFQGCSGLTSVEIPNSVTSIGEDAFNGTAWYNNQPNGVVYAGKVLYKYKGELPENSSIVVEEGALGIADKAFINCTNLTSIEIPNSVTKIGNGAFNYCTGLTSVEIPNSVTSIGDYAFQYCNGLTSVVIGDGVTSIGSRAFYGCFNLRYIYNNSDLTLSLNSSNNGYIAYYANSIIYPTDVVVGDYVFRTVDGEHALIANFCEEAEIILPENYLGENYSIGEYVFRNLNNIEVVRIPDSVTGIGDYAFYNCNGLKSLYMDLRTPPTITENTFYNVAATLYVPFCTELLYKSMDYWKDFANIEDIVESEVTITIGRYGSVTYSLPYALDFSNVVGLKAYVATGYDTGSGIVTLTRVQTAKEATGLLLIGEPGEYTVPVIEASYDNTLNLLVPTLLQTIVNSKTDDGSYVNFEYTIKDGDKTPMFYQFEDGSSLGASMAYLQLPASLFVSTASRSVSIRFNEFPTTDIDEVNDEVKGDSGEVKAIYDLSGRVVENPTSGIYIIDGKKVLVK